ncbi:MAG: L,D-transpeptidase family protein [Ignavibacteriales bacterium]|nr:L,D-transpeptidase family protein [Ignavibacteriales bacterium]
MNILLDPLKTRLPSLKSRRQDGIPRISFELALFCLFSLLLSLVGCKNSQSGPDPASIVIRNRLAAGGTTSPFLVRADSIGSCELLHAFYQKRSYRPAWSASKQILPDVDSLVGMIRDAEREGLRPLDYHLATLESVLLELGDSAELKGSLDPFKRADLDILLTDAYLLFASHLSEGCIDRDTLRMRWNASTTSVRHDSLLERSLDSHTLAHDLRQLLPPHPLYTDLRDLLASFRMITKRGGWGKVASGPPMKGGDVGSRIFALKGRLRVSGDLVPRSGAGGDEFDSTLVDAVRAFQKRLGLEPTGIADSSTIAAMNVPVEKRIEQIRVNLDRWRSAPHDLGQNSIRINIPDFRLSVFENGKEVETMKVVLGLPNWQTPVFSAELTQVLFNSHWMAPEDIVEKEMINYMKADSNYLRSNNMSLWRMVRDSLVQIDPRTVDWPSMNEKTVDFRLRQEAGPQNIMGQVKFLMPNRYNIYLHDTPYRDDFRKMNRMFSHGCIRLERPSDLAEFVLRQFPHWARERIDTVIARNTEQTVLLKKPIPVHILYYTVWREKDGSIQFRDDHYGLDRRLAWALQAGQMKMSAPPDTVRSKAPAARTANYQSPIRSLRGITGMPPTNPLVYVRF